MKPTATFREVKADDLDALLEIEAICFESDRLSRRSFQRWIKGDSSILFVLEIGTRVLGYGLVLLHAGTRLARLYSIALHPETRGRGYASNLMLALEAAAVDEDRLFMRLEVAKQNLAAIQLYQRLGYRVFGELADYYEDHSDALRMQKRIRYPDHTDKLTLSELDCQYIPVAKEDFAKMLHYGRSRFSTALFLKSP